MCAQEFTPLRTKKGGKQQGELVAWDHSGRLCAGVAHKKWVSFRKSGSAAAALRTPKAFALGASETGTWGTVSTPSRSTETFRCSMSTQMQS